MSSPQDVFRNLQKMADNARRSGGPSPKGTAGGVAGLLLLGGAIVVGNNALFNVDGGHRAIKYTRIGGVGKEIYSEGIYSVRHQPFGAITYSSSSQERISEYHGSRPQ